MNLEAQTLTDGAARSRRVYPSKRDKHSRSRSGLAHNSRARSGAASSAVLTERARIARELHDSVLQTLYAVTLSASRALKILPTQDMDEAHKCLEEVVRLANGAQTELRGLLTNIRSTPPIEGGLTVGLAALGADLRARTGLDVRLSLAHEPDLPVATKHALFLIGREALHNALKHAGATRVDIVLEVDCGQLVLMISDNGHGFDPMFYRRGHFGLQSMRERAVDVGGALELTSADGIGTRVRVCVAARDSGV